MRFAWYGRKSVYSDKSDSIDNQERMCREHAERIFPGQIDAWMRYSDEDFTGANANRPDLKRLIDDINAGLVDAVIVYQLDRLSRNVRDFANLFSLFEDKKIKFISVKESIDTSTPIGRTMMYMSVVFAQMEREQIAARVADNMIGLAKKGYWVGGRPPIGYTKERVTISGRKHVVLVPDDEGIKYINWLINTFLSLNKSLQGLEAYFKQNGIRTRSGTFFSSTQIFQLLSSPYGVPDAPEVYDYFADKGCQIIQPREEWDGTHGLIVYGRTTDNGSHGLSNPERWIVAIGHHEPILDATKWLEVQSRFKRNKFQKDAKYDIPLLKGIIRCSCGTLMSVSRKKKKDGSVSSWYYCRKRMRQGKEACGCGQIKIDILDSKVLEAMSSIAVDKKKIAQYIHEEEPTPHRKEKDIDADIAKTEKRIRKLVEALYTASGASAEKYIIEEINGLDNALKGLKREKDMAEAAAQKQKKEQVTAEEKVDQIAAYIKDFDSFTAKEKNEIAKKIIKRCVWDGKSLFLSF